MIKENKPERVGSAAFTGMSEASLLGIFPLREDKLRSTAASTLGRGEA
jgi:hypothetical protein